MNVTIQTNEMVCCVLQDVQDPVLEDHSYGYVMKRWHDGYSLGL